MSVQAPYELQEKPGRVGVSPGPALSLSTFLHQGTIRKTLPGLYLERGGGGASSSNFHSVAQDCQAPPPPGHHCRAGNLLSPTHIGGNEASLCLALIMPAFKNKM